MTNQERAEKIIQHIESIYGKRTGWVIDFITSQLDEAVREHHHCKDVKTICCEYAFKDGFASAREQAAGVAEGDGTESGMRIAERIRAMSPGDVQKQRDGLNNPTRSRGETK